MSEQEIVRHFFESDDYRSVAVRICEPDMEPAVQAYLLEQYYRQKNFEDLDFSRLIACVDIKRSGMLKQTLFRGLDLWASCRFRFGEPISAGMEHYVLRLRQCLEDRLSPGMYVNPVGLDHVELLRQYLNQAFLDEKTAELWANYFPVFFDDERRCSDFSIVFLLLMLVEERRGVMPVTELSTEPLSMLVRCGYKYLLSDINLHTSVANDIFCSVMDTAVQQRFYLRPDHEDTFSGIMGFYICNCVHSHFLSLLLRSGDSVLRDIVCKRFYDLFSHSPYLDDSRNVARLALAIPQDEMKECEPEWSRVLAYAQKLRDRTE